MEKFKKIIGILLIVVGVSLIASVGYKKYVTTKRNNQLIEDFRDSINTPQVEDKDEEDDNYLEEQDEEIDIDEINAIAIMEIPSIDLMQGIVEGIGNNVIKYYLGHFPESAQPGEEGNFAVAGHRVSSYTDAFVNLYKVKPGDDIKVTTREKVYTYKINEVFVVDPEDVYVLEESDEATITLVTCTVGGKQRVIVKGSLKTTEEL